MTTAIYVRISKDRDGDALGVARQEADCRALCEQRRWTPVHVLVDNDVSAYSGKARPRYAELVDGIKNRTFTRVVAWHPDRLHRSPRELEDFIALIEDTGCEVRTVTAGDFDLATPEGRLVARITGSVARKESEDKSRRLRRKHLELAAAGKDNGGGHRPFGYDDDRRTIRADEADEIRAAAAHVLAGGSLRSICTDWQHRGITGVTGKPISVHGLRRVLMSGRIAGWREHHGELVAPAAWPAIVDRDTVEQLRAILRDPARRKNLNARRYPFTGGLVRCGQCGAAMVARPNDAGERRYICASGVGCVGCGKTYIKATWVEDWVAAHLFRRVDSPEYFAACAAAEALPVDDPAVEIAGCQAKLEDLAEQWAADQLSRGEWAAARQAVQRRLDAARRRQTRSAATASQTVAPGSSAGLEASWAGLSPGEQQAVTAALVESIVIGPGRRGLNRFDPGRITIVWRA